MNSTFLSVLMILLVIRMPFYYRDELKPISSRIVKVSLETIALLLVLGWTTKWMWVILINFAANGAEFFWEGKTRAKHETPYLARTIPFALSLIAVSFYLPHDGLPQAFVVARENLKTFFPNFAFYSVFTQIQWNKMLLVLTGVLLCVVEANTVVRLLIDRLSLKPHLHDETSQHETATYNRGRIIGIMERILIFFCVFTGKYELAAFALTGKGLVRYRQMEHQEFAEYFLVGTLVSTISAGFIGVVTLWLYSLHS